MKYFHVLVLCPLILCFCGVLCNAENISGQKKSEPFDWVHKEKIRGTYTWASNFHHNNPQQVVEDVARAGFNSIFLKGLQDDDYGRIWISSAVKNQIRLFVIMNYYSAYDTKGELPGYMKKYRRAVGSDGKEWKSPCPLDDRYWNDRVLPGLLNMAKVSLREKSVVGILLDTEMYGLKPHAYLEDVCFCDDCFGKFLKKQNKEEIFSKIKKEDRHNWLKSEKLLRQYYEFLQNRMTDVFTKIRQKIHKTNSSVILGNLNYVNTWFFRSIAKGFGTVEMPAVVAAESPTYTDGYTPFVDDEVKRFKKEGFNVCYVPGIWDIQFFPDDLAVNCYKLAMHSDGYWDFTIRGLYKDLIPEFYAELMRKSDGCIDNYWNAFSFANCEIAKEMKTGGGCASPLNFPKPNIAKNSEVISVPAAEKGTLSSLTDGLADYSKPVYWNFGVNDKIILVADLGSVKPCSKIRMSFQGGGSLGGLYFPARIEVYGSVNKNEKTDLTDLKDEVFLGKASMPDKPFSFPENGQHSAGGYRQWITVYAKQPVECRYVKILIFRQPVTHTKKVTKINATGHRQILADELEIYGPFQALATE